jgi:cohesin loading factor subunit SCC2
LLSHIAYFEVSVKSARELTAATWGQELAFALKQCNAIISSGDESEVRVKAMFKFSGEIKTALQDVWKDSVNDVFDVGYAFTASLIQCNSSYYRSEEEVARIDRLAEEVGTIQSLKNSFHPILNVILAALDAPPVFMRTKALRALGQIVTSDPSILAAVSFF